MAGSRRVRRDASAGRAGCRVDEVEACAFEEGGDLVAAVDRVRLRAAHPVAGPRRRCEGAAPVSELGHGCSGYAPGRDPPRGQAVRRGRTACRRPRIPARRFAVRRRHPGCLRQDPRRRHRSESTGTDAARVARPTRRRRCSLGSAEPTMHRSRRGRSHPRNSMASFRCRRTTLSTKLSCEGSLIHVVACSRHHVKIPRRSPAERPGRGCRRPSPRDRYFRRAARPDVGLDEPLQGTQVGSPGRPCQEARSSRPGQMNARAQSRSRNPDWPMCRLGWNSEWQRPTGGTSAPSARWYAASARRSRTRQDRLRRPTGHRRAAVRGLPARM